MKQNTEQLTEREWTILTALFGSQDQLSNGEYLEIIEKEIEGKGRKSEGAEREKAAQDLSEITGVLIAKGIFKSFYRQKEECHLFGFEITEKGKGTMLDERRGAGNVSGE